MSGPEPFDAEGIARVMSVMDTCSGGTRQRAEQIVRAYLTAPPTWPSDDSVNAYHDDYQRLFHATPCGTFEQEREVLRRAFEADPIHQAAYSWVYSILNSDARIGSVDQRLIDAVKEAGLLA